MRRTDAPKGRRGAAGAEWVGIVTIAGVLLAGLLASAPAWAAGLTGKAHRVVCDVVGLTSCPRVHAPAPTAKGLGAARPSADVARSSLRPRLLSSSGGSPGAGGGTGYAICEVQPTTTVCGAFDRARCAPLDSDRELCVDTSGAGALCGPPIAETGPDRRCGRIPVSALDCDALPADVVAGRRPLRQGCVLHPEDGRPPIPLICDPPGEPDGTLPTFARCAVANSGVPVTAAAGGCRGEYATGAGQHVEVGTRFWGATSSRDTWACVLPSGAVEQCTDHYEGSGGGDWAIARPLDFRYGCISPTVASAFLGDCDPAGPAGAPGVAADLLDQTWACVLHGGARVLCLDAAAGDGPPATFALCAARPAAAAHDPAKSLRCAEVARADGRVTEACLDEDGLVWRCGGELRSGTSANPDARTLSTGCDGRRFAPPDAGCTSTTPAEPTTQAGLPSATCRFGGDGDPGAFVAGCSIDAGAPIDCVVPLTGAVMTEVGDRCPTNPRRRLQGGSDDRLAHAMTSAFCLAVATELAALISDIAGTLGLYMGAGGQVLHDSSAAHRSPMGELLQAAQHWHEQAVAQLGPFPAPVLVNPQPFFVGESVIVVQPDGTPVVATEHSFEALIALGATPVQLASGQQLAFIAGPSGTPGLLVVEPNASPAVLQFGQALAWVHANLPGISPLQTQVLAALVVGEAAIELADPRVAPTIRRGIGSLSRPSRWIKVVRQLKKHLAHGMPPAEALLEAIYPNLVPEPRDEPRDFVAAMERLQLEDIRHPGA